ncbi:hypothetical protein B0T14DRAFT_422946 [Immersiella caudata]|uniref:Uncharacterized protein n=1 Tax=Immersiella caudata TaxID=314043 RepID=A0AA40C7X6_9PEZI|nr:hypothetical protein B0T14DRAFT_422946 [Immersiella caudata]
MRHGELLWQAFLVAASSALFVLIILTTLTTPWTQALSDEQRPLSWWARVDFGDTLIAVRVMQGVLTAASTTAMSNSFTRLHWNKMANEKGLLLANLLAFSPTTSLMGTAQLIVGKHTKPSTRIYTLARLCLTTFPWVAGILLFARTSLITVFDTALVYNVTSGIGPFNASYVDSFINAFQDQDTSPPTTIVPYAYSSVVHNLITNSLFSTVAEPILCQPSERDLDCASYVVSGGLSLAAPWTPTGNPDHPLVRIRGVPAIQTEFQGRRGAGSSFLDSDCIFFGSRTNRSRIAADLCLSASPDGLLHAGLFLCDGLNSVSRKCRQEPRVDQPLTVIPNITTTMAVFGRQATVISARSNLTITSISDLTPPIPISMTASDVRAYRAALSWLMDFSAANIPAQSSILEIFWDNQDSLSGTYTDGILLQNFRGILAFPIWLFNANNYGNTALNNSELNVGLPPEFYTKAAVVSPLVKLHFDSTLLKVFIVLEGIVVLTLWVALFWLFAPWSSGASFVISSFPAFDFLFKTDVVEAVGDSRSSGDTETGRLKRGKGPKILKRVNQVVVYAASGSESQGGQGEAERVELVVNEASR